MVGTTDAVLQPRRVHLVPVVMRRHGEKVLVGRVDGSDWIELDPIGADVLEHLNQGWTIDEVEHHMTEAVGEPVDVLAFTRELETLGFVASADGERARKGIAQRNTTVKSRWSWRLFVFCTVAAGAYIPWSFFWYFVRLPTGANLLIDGIPLGLALVACACASLGVLVVHEMAHVLVARYYGLRPRVRLGRRGIWFVAETDLTSIWALPHATRWRPIVAGLMADVNLLAVSILVMQVAETTVVAVGARLCATVVLANILWQFQWYLRTDIYFLISVASGSPNLSQTARLWMRRHLRDDEAARDFEALSTQEVLAARAFLASLPIAVLASGVLWWWMLIPFIMEVGRRLLP